jgi:hypothetical protein
VGDWQKLASGAGGLLIREGVPAASVMQKGKRVPSIE